MNAHALATLEYNVLLEYLSKYANSAITRRRILELKPSGNFLEIQQNFDYIGDSLELMLNASLPMFVIPERALDVVAASQITGTVLSSEQLAAVASLLQGAETVRNTILNSETGGSLKSLAREIHAFPKLQRRLDKAIDEKGRLRDHASPVLNSIRIKMRRVQDVIRTRLQDMAQDLYQKDVLQDPTVSFRNESYVLPVKAGKMRAVPGIIHDRSASGATVFIEPQFSVADNRKLSDLRTRERKEERRILRELTAGVGENADKIGVTCNVLIEFDLIFSMAKFARDTGGKKISLRKEPGLRLVQCRNPLLILHKLFGDSPGTPEDVVPIDVEIGWNDQRILVITGPNTGGKTVALKTIGISAMMVQTGLFPVCSPDSEFGLFDDFYADIGDEQSMQQSLSTFSAHLKQIISILRDSDSGSMVLLDELGAGTDPTEGSALGIAILDELLRRNITTIATTHHNSIKAFAFSTPGIVNAAMEFDSATLKPTYRILMNRIGQSNAMAIAAHLGFPPRLIKLAEKHLQGRPADLEKIFKIVEKEKKSARKIRRKADWERERARSLRKAREDVLSRAEKEAAEIIAQAASESDRLLSELRDALKRVRKITFKTAHEIQRADKLEQAEAQLEKEMEKLAELARKRDVLKPEPRPATDPDYHPARGDWVRIDLLNCTGKIVTVHKDRSVTVLSDGKRLKVPISGIRREIPPHAGDNQVDVSFDEVMATDEFVSREINLTGQRSDAAVAQLEKYVDKAYRAGYRELRIVHGYGTGRLEAAVEKALDRNPLVAGYRKATRAEGGGGVSVAELVERK